MNAQIFLSLQPTRLAAAWPILRTLQEYLERHEKFLIAKHKKESTHNMGNDYEFLLPTSLSSIFQTYMESV